jgi:type II secretory pathway predicted ATPase ExeA
MYCAFYGLDERPFDLTPNPRFLLMTPHHREALSTLEYGIAGRKGVALVIGNAGTGKTTLVQAALNRQGPDSLGVCLTNPTLNRQEFLEFLVDGFGLTPDAATSKTRLLRELRQLLEARHARRAATALIIDEAQGLSDDLLQEVRLLANIETPTEKLLSVVLVGQPDLATRLNHPTLLHLKQRVALRAVLAPLDQTDTCAYIETRLRVAGWDGDPVFTPNAMAVVYNHSGGIPRTISVICDNALVAGFALGRRPVGPDVVLEVCRDLDFGAVHHERAVRPPVPERKVADVAARPALVSQHHRAGRMFDLETAAGGSGDRRTDVDAAAGPTAKLRIVFRSFRRQPPLTLFGESR